MADSGVKEAEAGVANLILDEVTGEKVSKSEYKRRQKNREKDAKKKEKEAAAPPKAEKQKSTEDDESNLAPNVSQKSIKMSENRGQVINGIFFL
jgi:lysyl-tRNA synthetase class 2